MQTELLRLYEATEVEEIVSRKVSKYQVEGHTREDLAQEARLAVWRAVERYSPEKGQLDRYASIAARNAILKLLVASKRLKRRAPVIYDHQLLSTSVEDPEDTPEERIVKGECEAELKDAIERIRGELRDKEVRVIDAFMNPSSGLWRETRKHGSRKITKTAVSTFLGLSPYQLAKIINKIRRKLKPVDWRI